MDKVKNLSIDQQEDQYEGYEPDHKDLIAHEEALAEWKKNNPDWTDKESKQIEYMTMVKNSMDDIYKDNRVNKVIKKICGNVYYNGEE